MRHDGAHSPAPAGLFYGWLMSEVEAYSSLYETAFSEVLKHEVGGAENGGLVNHPEDPGGTTKWGVSVRWLKSAGDLDGDGMPDGDIDGDGDIDAADIRQATRADAKRLYYLHWWRKYRYARFPQPVAIKTFDMAVNMGAKQAHRELQRASWATGLKISIDGVIGPETLQAANEADMQMLLAGIRSEAAGFYRMLIERNAALRERGHDVRDFSVFEDGWLKRAYA